MILAPISIPNMKALAQILFEISCTQDFSLLLSKGCNSKKGHNSDIKKYGSLLSFHEESVNEISKPSHSLFESFKFHQNVEKSIKNFKIKI